MCQNSGHWRVVETYPVHYRGPALHGHTLKCGQHGQTDVVERGYSCKSKYVKILKILFAIFAMFVCNVLRMAGNDEVVCALLLPLLGPSHFSRHIDSFRLTQCCD